MDKEKIEEFLVDVGWFKSIEDLYRSSTSFMYGQYCIEVFEDGYLWVTYRDPFGLDETVFEGQFKITDNGGG